MGKICGFVICDPKCHRGQFKEYLKNYKYFFFFSIKIVNLGYILNLKQF